MKPVQTPDLTVFLSSPDKLVLHKNKAIPIEDNEVYGGDVKNQVNGNLPATVCRFSMSRLSVLAVLGLCSGAAHAQSDVTLYGSLDGGLRNVVNGTPAGGAALTMASNGVYDQNRWGLRGSEDLGDGLKAVFDLQSGYVLSQGTLDNSIRDAQKSLAAVTTDFRVKLGGAWGQLLWGCIGGGVLAGVLLLVGGFWVGRHW